jgi:hypothetical protein
LGTIAVSRGVLGDRQGFADFDEVIELCTRLNATVELLRAWNNLTALYALHGDMQRTREGEDETVRLARQYGQHGTVRFIEGGAAAANRFHAGEWDDAYARANKIIADVDAGIPYYQSSATRAIRGLIRLARGDDEGPEADAELAIVSARPLKDPQAVNPILAIGAFIFASLGNRRRADETLTEAIDSLRGLRHLGHGVMELPYLMWAAVQLGREGELVERLDREPFKSPWLQAAVAVAGRDFHEAANIMGRGSFKADEAFFRLCAGGEPDVRAALAFYLSVGATRYIREGEALLAVEA